MAQVFDNQNAEMDRDPSAVGYFRMFEQALSWKALAHDAIDAIRVFQSHYPGAFAKTMPSLEERAQALVTTYGLGG